MDSLGWIVAILLLLGFGRSGLFGSFGLGVEVVSNQKPTPDGLPFMSNQNQLTGNPTSQPSTFARSPQQVAQLSKCATVVDDTPSIGGNFWLGPAPSGPTLVTFHQG